jgi:hypothetical protein
MIEVLSYLFHFQVMQLKHTEVKLPEVTQLE